RIRIDSAIQDRILNAADAEIGGSMSMAIPHATLRQLQRLPKLTKAVADECVYGVALSVERMEHLLASVSAYTATPRKAVSPSAANWLHVTVRTDRVRPGLQGVVDAITGAAIKLAQWSSKIAIDNKAIDAGMQEARERADAAMEAAVVGLWIGIAQGLAQVSAAGAAFTRG